MNFFIITSYFVLCHLVHIAKHSMELPEIVATMFLTKQLCKLLSIKLQIQLSNIFFYFQNVKHAMWAVLESGAKVKVLFVPLLHLIFSLRKVV